MLKKEYLLLAFNLPAQFLLRRQTLALTAYNATMSKFATV